MRFMKIANVVAAIVVTGTAAFADEKYPTKTIEVITHAVACGGTDFNSYMMILCSRHVLKTDMAVVNKRGGDGALAMQYFR